MEGGGVEGGSVEGGDVEVHIRREHHYFLEIYLSVPDRHFVTGLTYSYVKLLTLATILRVAFISCTGMLTVVTTKINLKLKACSVPQSKSIE